MAPAINSVPSAAGRSRSAFGVLVMFLVGFGLTGCADEEPMEFTEGTKAGFMAACSDLLEDSRFVGEICDCVFEQTQDEISFNRFATIDQQLVENPERPLTTDVVTIVADCVIEVTEL